MPTPFTATIGITGTPSSSDNLAGSRRFDAYPLALCNVYLVEGHDHPGLQLEELEGEEEVPLEDGGVDDVH